MEKNLIEKIECGNLDNVFEKVYGTDCVEYEKKRVISLVNKFEEKFNSKAEHLFSAPGRTEIGGNHTDHQKGSVLAASINLDALAVVSKNNASKIRIQSQGYDLIEIDIKDLDIDSTLYGTTQALVKGIIVSFIQKGCDFTDQGFDAYIVSDVFSGSGLSSSAAFEVLVGNIINKLYYNEKATPIEIAQIGQFAENIYFGKPCGLMDQMACSVGGVISIDFSKGEPIVNNIALNFEEMGHALCIVDSGVDHADLTDEYANIADEMLEVSKNFGKNYLSEVNEKDFYTSLSTLKNEVKGRAILRAIHYFNENILVAKEAKAIEDKNFDAFLNYVKTSGISSMQCLQNIVETGEIEKQGLLLTITVCQQLLSSKGAVRVHGGGFAGTAQAFVPVAMVSEFKQKYEEIFGGNTCHVLSIRAVGGICLA